MHKLLKSTSFRDFSKWGPMLGSLLFHLAIFGALIGFVANTTVIKPPSLPVAITVSIAYLPPPSPSASPQIADSIPEPVKPEIKSDVKIPVKKPKKKQVVKQQQKPIAETDNDSDAEPAENTITSAKPSTGGDNTGARDSDTNKEYTATLLAWLERHKHYPRQARISRMEGNAILYFRIDRDGKVLDYQLVQSTGHYVLDDAVIDMIKSASPVPTPPTQLSIAELNFRVPVTFALN
jgi:protein TonB